MNGRVFRIGSGWPSREGTVQVTYNAGYTEDQLSGVSDDGVDASAIKLGVLSTMQGAYEQVKRIQENISGSGDIKSERLGDYSVTYDVGVELLNSKTVSISRDTKLALREFRHWAKR